MLRKNDIGLIVFLGNPGRPYEQTRHNIAWMLADRWDAAKNLSWKEKFRGRYSQILRESRPCVLLRPETYMNRSGESVQACARFFRIEPPEILVVHDDLELDFGWMGIKRGGGMAGHNGLRSTGSSLGSRDFLRFRLGISRPGRGSASGHVLGKFTESEQALLPSFLEKAAEILNECLGSGVDARLENDSKKMLINA